MSSTVEGAYTIYRYGRVAWFWRSLIAGAFVVGGLCIIAGVRWLEPGLLLVGAPLILPAWFFGWVVATQVDLLNDDGLVVTTMLGSRRRLTRVSLGRPRHYLWAQATVGRVYAPRAWIPVRGGWPVYLDLFGEIIDRREFLETFQVDKRHVPDRSARQPSGRD